MLDIIFLASLEKNFVFSLKKLIRPPCRILSRYDGETIFPLLPLSLCNVSGFFYYEVINFSSRVSLSLMAYAS